MTTEELLSFYKPLAGTRLNFVTNPNLSFSGRDNTSAALSNQADRALLKHLRSISDLVVTDSATASIEKYKPSKFAEIEIWSRSGDFRNLTNVPANPPFFGLSLHQVTDIAHRLSELSENFHSVLFESGPTLSKALSNLQIIDELCLTVTGAPDEAGAMRAAQQWVIAHGFDYLTFQTGVTFASAFFAKLVR
jgi:hypothetical protein